MRVPRTARRSNQSILREINPEYSLEGLMLKLKLQYFGYLMRRIDLLEKTLMLGKIEGRRMGRQRMMVAWHHQLNGHEFEQAPGVGDGQGSLECCSPWGYKESDTTDRLNNNKYPEVFLFTAYNQIVLSNHLKKDLQKNLMITKMLLCCAQSCLPHFDPMDPQTNKRDSCSEQGSLSLIQTQTS